MSCSFLSSLGKGVDSVIMCTLSYLLAEYPSSDKALGESHGKVRAYFNIFEFSFLIASYAPDSDVT